MNTSKSNRQDLIAGLVTMIAGAFFFITTIGTKSFTTGTIRADTIPKAIAVSMFLLGGGIIAHWILHGRSAGSTPHDAPASQAAEDTAGKGEQDKHKNFYRKITTPVSLLLIFLYIFLMDKIGFVVSTILYLTAQITLLSTDMSWKSVLKSFLIALVSGILIFLIFGKAFKLPLPVNDFGF